jgi:protocatechuate 3,4-dioxygenase alpha subunit
MPTPTPSQTIGPFFAYCLTSSDYGYKLIADNVINSISGQKIQITGQVLDGGRRPIPDAMLEIWQADPEGQFYEAGKFKDPSFTGFARTGTDLNGNFLFRTVKPGVFKNSTGILQAPHINLTLFARGLLRHLTTRIYFSDEEATYKDPFITHLVPEPRRNTLVARLEKNNADHICYTFNINLQGENETAFLHW